MCTHACPWLTFSAGAAGGVAASSNERGADAAECLEGMHAASVETPKAGGRVLARAPEVGPGQELGPAVASLLKPSDQPLFQRWKQILRVVLGRGTGAPHQIAVIMVSPQSLGCHQFAG